MDQSGDVLDVAVGRREQVGRQRLEADAIDVAVRVDEAGDHRLALEI